MHVLPGAWQTIPPEKSRKPNEDHKGEQQQGGVHENKCHHSMRTFQNYWQKLNYVTGKKRMKSATTIQVENKSGAILERTTQDTVE